MLGNNKNKILVWLVIVLIIANAGTLTFLWLSRPDTRESPAAFLSKELSFTQEQKNQYEAMVKEHRDSIRFLRAELKHAKEEMYLLLKDKSSNDSIGHTAVKKLSAITEQMEIITLDHFRKVRSICSSVQQEKFDQVISQMLQMMSSQRLPPPGREQQGPPPIR